VRVAFLSLARSTASVVAPAFPLYTENQPHRHLVAICQLQNYVRDLSRIAFRSPRVSQHLVYRTDRASCLAAGPAFPPRAVPVVRIPPGSSVQILTPNGVLPCQRVAETATATWRVIRRIAGNPEATTDRRHLKDVTALCLRITGTAARVVYTTP